MYEVPYTDVSRTCVLINIEIMPSSQKATGFDRHVAGRLSPHPAIPHESLECEMRKEGGSFHSRLIWIKNFKSKFLIKKA